MQRTSMGNRTVSTMLMRELQAAMSPTTTVAAGRFPCALKRTKLLMMFTCGASRCCLYTACRSALSVFFKNNIWAQRHMTRRLRALQATRCCKHTALQITQQLFDFQQ